MRKDRLLLLADHLESGKLGHDAFYFGDYHVPDVSMCHELKALGITCGSVGCALGECPTIFPNDWSFDNEGYPTFGILPRRSGACAYFGIDLDEVDHLFMPGQQRCESYGGQYLQTLSTKEQVASNIRAFVASKETKNP